MPIEGSVIVVLTTFAAIGFGLATFISYTLPGIIFMVSVVAYYSWKTSKGTTIELPRSTVTFSQAAKITLPILLLMVSLYLYEMKDVTYSIIIGTIIFVGLTLAFLKPNSQQIKGAIMSMDKQLILTLVLIFLFAATVSQLPFIKQLAATVITSSFTIPVLIMIGYFSGLILGSSSGMATLIFPLNRFPASPFTFAFTLAG